VIAAISELTEAGLLAASRSKGRSTAYRIIRQAAPAQRPTIRQRRKEHPEIPIGTSESNPKICVEAGRTGPKSLDHSPSSGQFSLDEPAQNVGLPGQATGPKQELPLQREDTTTIPIPGTPFRLTAEGRLLVAVDLQELLTSQGIPRNLAGRLVAQKDPEAVAKVLLNALYLQSQGKLQNGPGYIRAGIEDGYDLLPQVAHRLEGRRRELEARLRSVELQAHRSSLASQEASEEAAIAYVLHQLGPIEVQRLVEQAVALLPEPLVRRNPTLSNPFVRGKVYELACGEPIE
jgi:hypothetical protein